MIQDVPVLDVLVDDHLVFQERTVCSAELFKQFPIADEFDAHREVGVRYLEALVL